MITEPAHESSFADRYESVLVPVIFVPWAKELIRRAAPTDGEHILDLGCGTGVVTREIVHTGAIPGSLTGADNNADMLGVAHAWAANAGIPAEWIEADAANLPFPDDRFDLAFCQQSLQFFPDRVAALRELRRVVKGGGRVAFCVSRALSENPLLQSQATALEKHVGSEAGAAVRAICGLPYASDIRSLFEEAGFRNINVETVCLMLHHPDGRAFAAGAMGGMHTDDKLNNLTDAAQARCVEDFLAGLGDCFDGVALRFPHVSNAITATA